MKNYFVIHALGRTADNYWYKFIKNSVETKKIKCYIPTFPPIEEMSYDSWAKTFEPYKKYVNEESVFIGHSTGSIFAVKYLKFISVVGFNKPNTNSINPVWDEINKTFFVEDLQKFQAFAKTRISFYSPTDIYDFQTLDDFATKINAKKEIIQNAGHFTKGYEKAFPKILDYL